MGKVLPYSHLRNKQMTLATLKVDIHAAFGSAFRHEAEAESQRVLAGELLIEARKRVDAGEAGDIGWEAWCKANIQRSLRDIRRVMKLAGAADQEEAQEQERAATRKRMQKHRAGARAPGTPKEQSEQDTTVSEGNLVERALAKQRADKAASMKKSREGNNITKGPPRGGHLTEADIPAFVRGAAQGWEDDEPAPRAGLSRKEAMERWERALCNHAGTILAARAFWNKEFGDWTKFPRSSVLKTLVAQAAEEWKAIATTVKADLPQPVDDPVGQVLALIQRMSPDDRQRFEAAYEERYGAMDRPDYSEAAE